MTLRHAVLSFAQQDLDEGATADRALDPVWTWLALADDSHPLLAAKSIPELLGIAKRVGLAYERNEWPQAGDIFILYDRRADKHNHIGVVALAGEDSYRTIELLDGRVGSKKRAYGAFATFVKLT